MIPKKLHYIWLSDEPVNAISKKCIKSWKIYAPDFEVVRWSMKDFDFSKMPAYVNEAIEQRKWAFACDYLRLLILYNEGGLYLDSDVLLLKSIGDLFNHSFVSSVEYYPKLFSENREAVNENGIASMDYVTGLNIQAAVMASEPRHPFVRDCMNYYKDRHFVDSNGISDISIVAPQVYSFVARSYGFRYVNEAQTLDNDMFLYKSEVFAPGYYEMTGDPVAIHLCNGSWRNMSVYRRIRTSLSAVKHIILLSGRK